MKPMPSYDGDGDGAAEQGAKLRFFEEEREKYTGMLFVGWNYINLDWEFWSWQDVDKFISDRGVDFIDNDEDEERELINEMCEACGGNMSHYNYVEPTRANIQFYSDIAGLLTTARKRPEMIAHTCKRCDKLVAELTDDGYCHTCFEEMRGK
jgi:hypothetical protein